MYHTRMQRKKREESILLSLKKLDFLTTSQLQDIHDLKSTRNAQRVLKQMEEYLNVIRDGENIYYLNSKGREVVNCDKIRTSTGNVAHYVMRNHIFVRYHQPASWENEIRFKSIGSTKKDTITCVADAVFKQGDRFTIVEVDNLQKMKKNKQKIEKYRKLILRGTFGMIVPKFIWLTNTEYRRKELENICQGLYTEIYTIGDFNK